MFHRHTACMLTKGRLCLICNLRQRWLIWRTRNQPIFTPVQKTKLIHALREGWEARKKASLCPICGQPMVREPEEDYYCPTCRKHHETHRCKTCDHLVVVMRCDVCKRPLEHDGNGHWHCPRGHKPRQRRHNG